MKLENLMEQMMTIDQCSEITGISVSALRKMCMRKEIPFHKFGRLVRFYKPDIANWIKDNKAA